MRLLRLLAVFTIIPLIEILLLLEVGTRIGTLNTLFLILLTGLVGAYLMHIQGFAVLGEIQNDLARGVPPARKILEGALVLAGGILLLTPGFFTDGIGMLLLVPQTRRCLLKKIQRAIEKRIHSHIMA
ncbi:MAG: FxsA family protein [Deltaproteobacteria bacterium]|nr:FxsA family protein [Deltaproteobacteria bacterium]